MPETKQASPLDWKTELFRMMIGQGPAFVTMAIMLWILTAAIKDFVKVEIPKHIAAINAGYEKINTENAIANSIRDKHHSESLKTQQETFLKALEHYQNIVKLRIQEEKQTPTPLP